MAVFSPASFKASARLRSRWHSFRLDMTPLVDLAFLLLTFFLLHAGIAKPRVMQLLMPHVDNSENDYYGCCHLRGSGVMTIMLGRNHSLHYYYGLNNPFDTSVPAPEVRKTDFSTHGIRQVLLTQEGPLENLILIKPTPQATYKDIVDILDEMNITSQKKYALVDISANDTKLLSQAGY